MDSNDKQDDDDTLPVVELQTPMKNADGSSHHTQAVRRRTDSAPAALTTNPGRDRSNSRKKGLNSVDDEQNSLIKYGSLVLLVAQMVGLVLLMRYSRTQLGNDGEMYLASTAVFVMEVRVLFITSIFILFLTFVFNYNHQLLDYEIYHLLDCYLLSIRLVDI